MDQNEREPKNLLCKADTYPPLTYYDDSDKTPELKTVSLSATMRSLDEFEFFRNENLFDDSASEEEDDTEKGPQTYKLPYLEEKSHSTEAVFEYGLVIPTENYRLLLDSQKINRINENLHNASATEDEVDSCHLCVNTNVTESNGLSRKNSIIYICSEDFVCNDECCCEMECADIPLTIHESQRSAIYFVLAEECVENTRIDLYSSNDSHYFEIVSENSQVAKQMLLRHGDKLLGINYQAVQFFHHNIVLEMLKYLLYPSSNAKITLIVERQEQNGKRDILEIIIVVKVATRGNPFGNEISASIRFSPTLVLYIKNVRLKDCFQCRIHSGKSTRYYITMDSNTLCMQPLKHGNETKSTFLCYIYHGLCMKSSHRPSPLFIAVLQSCHNDNYIMASSRTKLSLVEYPSKLNTNFGDIPCTKVDPRFFAVFKTHSGERYFQSLLYPDSYWIISGREVELAERLDVDLCVRDDWKFGFVRM